MGNVNKYYADIAAKRTELAGQFPQGDCLVISVNNQDKNSTAGNMAEVPVGMAARLLVEGTHRVATPEDHKAFKDGQEKARKDIAAANLENVRKQFSDVLGGKRP